MQGRRPPRLMYLWSQMQCPAVNLMIPPSRITSERWELKHLCPFLFGREQGESVTRPRGAGFNPGGPTLLPSSRRSRLIISPPSPTATYYIKRLHCLFSIRPVWESSFVLVDACSVRRHPLLMGRMYTQGHQLIWVTRFSKEQIFDIM